MKIRNWGKFQHYKHRRPPWIRLYRELLDDRHWHALSGDASKLLINLWLLAADTNNGLLPEVEDIAFRLRMPPKLVSKLIGELSHWLTLDASDLLAECERVATTETETETETEGETESECRAEFLNAFWPTYPNKVGKPNALTAYLKARKKASKEEISRGLDNYLRDKPPDRQWCNPATWLNQERWGDEMAGVSAPQSRTQAAIINLRERAMNGNRFGGPGICNGSGELSSKLISSAGAGPGGLRQPTDSSLRREAESVVEIDGESGRGDIGNQ
jgi:hypothetical protein